MPTTRWQGMQMARGLAETIWPARDRRAWGLYSLGMETLAGLGTKQTRAFFSAFFALPSDTWWSFLAGTLSPMEVLGAMAGLFTRADGVRGRLIRSSTQTLLARMAS